MTERTLRGRTAVVGVGETTYYRHGQAPEAEFVLCLKAILAACRDAGLDPTDIDGFASYSNDRNDAARDGRLCAAARNRTGSGPGDESRIDVEESG